MHLNRLFPTANQDYGSARVSSFYDRLDVRETLPILEWRSGCERGFPAGEEFSLHGDARGFVVVRPGGSRTLASPNRASPVGPDYNASYGEYRNGKRTDSRRPI